MRCRTVKDCQEYVVSEMPFVVRRRVRWAECDPAGVVYTGRFTDYVLDALMHFVRHAGHGPHSQNDPQNRVRLPMKHMSMTFHISLYPNDAFETELVIADIQERTFDVKATARLLDGRTAFEATCTPICILPDERMSTRIPKDLRTFLEGHRRILQGVEA